MKEDITFTKTTLIPQEQLDRYIVYRVSLLSFEDEVRSGKKRFEELVEFEKTANDFFEPFVRMSSLDLKLSLEEKEWKKPPMKKVKPKPPVFLKEIRRCPICGKTFVAGMLGRTKIYCSYKCRAQNFNKEHPVTHICQQCGKEFVSHKGSSSKYCSVECYRKARFSKKKIQKPQPKIEDIVFILQKLLDDGTSSSDELRQQVKIFLTQLEQKGAGNEDS